MKPCSCGDVACIERVSSDYDLKGAPLYMRMLALLHASGADMTMYYDPRQGGGFMRAPSSNGLGERDL